jgi:transcriptional regulator with XRE-family HTH domain
VALPADQPPGRDDHSLRAIGAELHRLRQSSGLSLRDLGKRAGLTPGFLSLVERGECSLSLTSLFALSRALDVPAAELIQGGLRQPAPADFAVWPAEPDPRARMTVGEREYWRLHAGIPGRQLEPLRMRILPTRTPSPPVTHAGEEFGYILRGQLTITLAGTEVSLGPGQSVHFRSSIPHAVCNRSRAAVDALWVVTANFSELGAASRQH